MHVFSLRSSATLVLGALLLLAALLVFFVLAAQREQRETHNIVYDTNSLIADLNELQIRLSEAESGQRGFLLTGDIRYLRPYDAALSMLPQLLSDIRQSLSSRPGDGSELRNFEQVEQIVAARTDALKIAIGVRNSGDAAGSIARVKKGEGWTLMESLRDRISTIIVEQERRVNLHMATGRRQQDMTVLVSLIGMALAVLLMMAAGGLVTLYLRANRLSSLALQTARDVAESADKAKSRFLATASHDLRQPLHAMNLFISALRRRATTDEIRQLVASMASATDSMQMMFNSLLDVSKLQAGVVAPEIQDFPVEEVFSRLRITFGVQAVAKGLVFDIPPTATLLRTDPVLLESILSNLLANAVRYTRRGSVSLLCRERGGFAALEVHDTGPGIPADQIELAFEEFRRLDASNAMERGLGLGLSIVRRLGKLLDLEIDVESEIGTGTNFTVQVPTASVSARKDTRQIVESIGSLEGKRFLLVDDDPLILVALAQEIADWGSEAIVAHSVEAALSALGSRPPDIAIVDRDLGAGQSGVELIGLLRKRFGHAIPVIIVSGATDTDVLADSTKSGALWLTKPLDVSVLQQKVIKLLHEQPAV